MTVIYYHLFGGMQDNRYLTPEVFRAIQIFIMSGGEHETV